MNWSQILKAAGGAIFGGRGGMGGGGNMMPRGPQWGGGSRGMPGFGGMSGPGGGIPGQEVMMHGDGDRQKFLGLDSDWAAIIARMLQGVGGYFGEKRAQDLEEARWQYQKEREERRGRHQGNFAAAMLGLDPRDLHAGAATGATAGPVVSGPSPTPSPTVDPRGNQPPIDLEEMRRGSGSRFGGMFRPRGHLG